MIELLLCALLAPDFEADCAAASSAYESLKSRTDKELTAGNLAAAQQMFLDAVPEDKRTAAHWFMLGNMWFDLDPAFAMRMHEKAFALAPDEPMVQREWALDLHRARRHAEAETLYAKLVSKEAGEEDEEEAPLVLALRADCLLELGRYTDAAETWAAARKGNAAHALHGFVWVYGPEDPLVRRVRLLNQVSAGQLEHAEELLLGDVFWRPEEGRYFVQYEYMTHDGGVVSEKLGKESARAKDLEAVVDYLFVDWEQRFPRGEGSVPRKQLEDAARKRGWFGESPRLPADDRVAAAVVDALRDQKLRTPEELLADFGPELEKRAAAPGAPPEILKALIQLARKAKSPKIDDYKKLAPDDGREIARKAVADARAAKQPTAALLVAQIRAEVRAEKPSGTELDKAFAALAAEPSSPR